VDPLGRGGSLKDEITYIEGTIVYPSSVVAAKSLLVASRSHHSSVLYLLEHVNICLVLFFSSLLVVEVDAWGVEVEVGGDDRLSPVEQFMLVLRLQSRKGSSSTQWPAWILSLL